MLLQDLPPELLSEVAEQLGESDAALIDRARFNQTWRNAPPVKIPGSYLDDTTTEWEFKDDILNVDFRYIKSFYAYDLDDNRWRRIPDLNLLPKAFTSIGVNTLCVSPHTNKNVWCSAGTWFQSKSFRMLPW